MFSEAAGDGHQRDITVYDVGANNGDDVVYYLKKAQRVIAIEANPELCAALETRFRTEIAQNRLQVLNVAVIDGKDEGSQFYIDNSSDKISSVIPIKSADAYTQCRVAACRISSIIADRGGAAEYVKIDTEGTDAAILREMFSAGIRPRYVSAEAQSIEVLCQLVSAGYKKFKIIEGRFVHYPFYELAGDNAHKFPAGSASGPFGDDIPGPYLSADQIFEYLREYGTGWKDIHATWEA